MRLTDAQMEKALINLNITKDLIECGLVAKNKSEAIHTGKNIQMIGEDNLPQLIAITEDLIYYKSKLEEIQKALEWYADYNNYSERTAHDGFDIMLDFGEKARQSLQSIQGGNTHANT